MDLLALHDLLNWSMWVDTVRLNYSTVICILRLPLAKYNYLHSGEADVLYSEKQGLVPSPVFRERVEMLPGYVKAADERKFCIFGQSPRLS